MNKYPDRGVLDGKALIIEASLIGIYAFFKYIIDFRKDLKFNKLSIEINLRFISFALILCVVIYSNL